MHLDPAGVGYNLKAVPCRASKVKLNMITACQSVQYGELRVKVFTYCPGHTVSNLAPCNKANFGTKPAREGAAPIVEILNVGGMVRMENSYMKMASIRGSARASKKTFCMLSEA